MGEDARQISAVGREQRLEDLAILLAELAAQDAERWRLSEVAGAERLVDQGSALVERHEQERVLPQRAAQLHVDPPLGEVRIGLAGPRSVVA
ncbi:MAG: hypothetical protein QM778_08315 [Myxococcales bacterium]